MNNGTITTWNDPRGFGYITTPSGERYFVHISAFGGTKVRPEPGDIVTFSPGVDAEGRPRATRVSGVGGRIYRKRSRPASVTYAWLLGLAIALLIAIVFGSAPLWFGAVYAGMSVITFAVYARDKSAARAKRQRTSENSLLTLGLLCGWPGAMLAQQWLRHKSMKASFLNAFWVTVVLNCVTLVVLSLPEFWTWLRAGG